MIMDRICLQLPDPARCAAPSLGTAPRLARRSPGDGREAGKGVRGVNLCAFRQKALGAGWGGAGSPSGSGGLPAAEHVTVFCGSTQAPAGPACTWQCSLQKHYRDSGLHLVLHESMADLVSTLPWEPSVHTLLVRPRRSPSPVPGGTLLFAASRTLGASDGGSVHGSSPGRGPRGVRVSQRPGSDSRQIVPGHRLRHVRSPGNSAGQKWRPRSLPDSPTRRKNSGAGEQQDPAVHPGTPRPREYWRAPGELPLRLVLLDGREGTFPKTPLGVLMAVVAGASAVITDPGRIGCTLRPGDTRGGVRPPVVLPSAGRTPSRGVGAGGGLGELLRRGW